MTFQISNRPGGSERRGFALVTVIMAITVVSMLVVAFSTTTRLELASIGSTSNAASGFHAAEAGLNIRGEETRATFQGYERPSGTSPDAENACSGSNQGSGNFACDEVEFNGRTATTYVVEDPRNNDPDDSERMITIPSGERFAGLNAIQYRYSVISEAAPSTDSRPEAILEMVFRARLVPLFQFAAFYDKDLEILPGPQMTLGGPVHVNGDLYLNADAGPLHITGAITVAQRADDTGGELWRGRKNTPACNGTVRINDVDASTNPDPSIDCPHGRIDQDALDAGWNGRIETGFERLTVPDPEEFGPGGRYWEEADIVVALDLRDGLDDAAVVVPNRDVSGGLESITINTALTDTLNNSVTCQGSHHRSYGIRNHAPVGGMPPLPSPQRAIEWSNTFRDRRENEVNNQRTSYRLMLEVDVGAFMDCLHEHPELFGDGPSTERDLDDTSSGGLVWYFTVVGDDWDDASSGYGVRLRNGSFLGRSSHADPQINGLTVVTDQALFVQGDYNLDGAAGGPDWRPAGFITDAVNILSKSFDSGDYWEDHSGNPSVAGSYGSFSAAYATNTTIQAAILSGTQTTGGAEGTGAQNCGSSCYNGGLENYPTLHERWNPSPQKRLTYLGSFVSLERPRHSSGPWSYGAYYDAPIRDWGYDSRFNDAQNLPPLSPRFVYLVQERFVREFYR